VKLLIEALKKERENDAWDMWLTLYPRMNKENFMSFEDFKKEVIKSAVRVSNKTKEEIEEEMLKIVALDKRHSQ
jgi:hypothetical protein